MNFFRYCDGTKDCDDKSDEPSSCGSADCDDNYFECTNKKCIYKSFVCDGEDDCGDGSDESTSHGKQFILDLGLDSRYLLWFAISGSAPKLPI